jgi:mitogen-activated protein kinase kinase kinase
MVLARFDWLKRHLEVVKQTSYTSKADVWSLGCVTIEMLTGDHPHIKLNQMQALFKVRSSPTVTAKADE